MAILTPRVHENGVRVLVRNQLILLIITPIIEIHPHLGAMAADTPAMHRRVHMVIPGAQDGIPLMNSVGALAVERENASRERSTRRRSPASEEGEAVCGNVGRCAVDLAVRG